MKAPRKRRRRQAPTITHCAIYTRKNIGAGRASKSNSIRRQRKAIRTFIASRKSQGWACLPKAYEDIGYSAGNLRRPALKKLLADMDAGNVDRVVVYSLDRLTRSPSDLATLFATFRRCGVMLVIVSSVIFGAWGKTVGDVSDANRATGHQKRRRLI